MLPSLNQLADGSDDATVKALAGTVAILLGGAGLQDSFYTEQSTTRVISRLETAEGADAERIEPALTALKHLRDVSADACTCNDAHASSGAPSSCRLHSSGSA